MVEIADRKRALLARQRGGKAGTDNGQGADHAGLTAAERKALVVLITAGGAQRRAKGEGIRYIPEGLKRGLAEDLVMRAERLDLVRRDGERAVPTEAGIAWARREAADAAVSHRDQHGAVTRSASGPARDLAESPLAWLHRRRDRDGQLLIGHTAFDAGERLRADFTLGNLAPRMSIRWDGQPSAGFQGGGELTDSSLGARQRVRRAMEAVGPELSGVLLDVCCFLKGLEEVERDRRWPARSAKTILGLALARLARHYGIGDEAVGTRRPGRIESARNGEDQAV